MIFEGITDPETLEAMAVTVREGLSLAEDLLLTRIRIASDCISVIKALGELNMGSYCHILKEINTTAGSFSEATLIRS